jgi:hypothetical protein
MSKQLDEGNLLFDFPAFLSAERFDSRDLNVYGMKCVDFVAEDADNLYFIEAKDYQHPKATTERRKKDYEMLVAAVEDKNAILPLEMGGKIKDSLLRKFSAGEKFLKNVTYLLLINLDKFSEFERGLLKTKISGHVPTGLGESRFSAFTSITFELVNIEQLKNYGVICTEKVSRV